METRKIIFYLLTALLGGCVPVMSLHPLYTEKEVVFEEKLLGTWVDDINSPNTTWEFKRPDEKENKYRLIFADNEGKRGLFDAHLMKLGDRFFLLDVFPSEPPWDEDDPNKVNWVFNTLFLVPVHTFIKINGIEPRMNLQLTDDEDFKELLEENPSAVEFATIEEQPVLTAPTGELQAFVLKYADDKRLFPNEVNLVRKKVYIEPGDAEPDKPSEK